MCSSHRSFLALPLFSRKRGVVYRPSQLVLHVEVLSPVEVQILIDLITDDLPVAVWN